MMAVASKLLGFCKRVLARREPAPPPAPPVNIERIEIAVHGADDPNRVARLTLEHLQKLSRRPPPPEPPMPPTPTPPEAS